MNLVLSLFLSASALATHVPTAAERACAAGVYCAEKMICTSRIEGSLPRGMHPDYTTSIVTFRSMKSTKKLANGERTLVDALQTNEDFTGPAGISLEEAKAKADLSYGNYGPPARLVNGRGVLMAGAGFSQGYRFTIVSSQAVNGVRVDQLVGEEYTVGSVVPDYARRLTCEAEVVTAPSRVDDFTRN
jgi:hypothetical protein